MPRPRTENVIPEKLDADLSDWQLSDSSNVVAATMGQLDQADSYAHLDAGLVEWLAIQFCQGLEVIDYGRQVR
jgi:hypothetical protein